MSQDWLSELRWDKDGLVPAVVQDARSGEVLMVAWANREALEQTIATGETHFYSRSRRSLWHKGGTSGHVQRVEEIRVDCDADVVLLRVSQVGGACHAGFRSCFHRAVGRAGQIETRAEKVFDPESVYRRGGD